MELLLNLAWLLLALPAYWLWRNSRQLTAGRKFSSLQCLLALGCMLVILFPVVSATDDLRAMRAEMEESPASKRNVRYAPNDKSSTWKPGLQNLPALPATLLLFALAAEPAELPLSETIFVPAAPPVLPAARAPPVFSRA